ncbi:hypothetical protein EV421DRAFT_1948284 [Armillaria borealis]|uniref:Uncharacterized protein n=1 Tax=Armillaria borealis TaxID=47425 RepID=A0AA39ITJ3_9AGAR|nr:hypothetical protein EV421DRAFT_1948284 [Armillaria borealis]
MSSWLSRKGMKSIIELGLSGAINLFAPKPAFYVQRSLGRGPFFEQDKSKQDLRGEHGKRILEEARRRFGFQVWRSGVCTLALAAGWHSSKKNLNRIKHYTIRGFNPAGKMVFTAELADRVVDSEAWVYEANKMGITFKGNEYRRVVGPSPSPSALIAHGAVILHSDAVLPMTPFALLTEAVTGVSHLHLSGRLHSMLL